MHAFLATLAKDRLQEFDRGRRKFDRDLRQLQELDHWGIHLVVALLLILTQASLLFCVGVLVLTSSPSTTCHFDLIRFYG
jgi:hypothetical protein